MKIKIKHIGLLSAAAILLLAGCGKNSASEPSALPLQSTGNAGKIKAVATFYPMVEFTRQVAGSHAEVISLIPAGVEPHDWEPSAKDIAQLKEADVFVYNGIVEEWVEDVLSSTENDKRVVVEASRGIELMEGSEEEEHEEEEHDGEENGEHDHGHGPDPHVWLSPVLAQQEVKAIEAALAQADPAHKEDYAKNAADYIGKLKELDSAYREGLKDVKRTEFVTQHAAFGYLAREYGLTQVAIAGLSPEQEPSPDRMVELVQFAREKQVKTIFFETLVNPKIAETIANELGAKTDVLNPLEGLTDEEASKGLDYIEIMNNNLAALQKALNE